MDSSVQFPLRKNLKAWGYKPQLWGILSSNRGEPLELRQAPPLEGEAWHCLGNTRDSHKTPISSFYFLISLPPPRTTLNWVAGCLS